MMNGMVEHMMKYIEGFIIIPLYRYSCLKQARKTAQ